MSEITKDTECTICCYSMAQDKDRNYIEEPEQSWLTTPEGISVPAHLRCIEKDLDRTREIAERLDRNKKVADKLRTLTYHFKDDPEGIPMDKILTITFNPWHITCMWDYGWRNHDGSFYYSLMKQLIEAAKEVASVDEHSSEVSYFDGYVNHLERKGVYFSIDLNKPLKEVLAQKKETRSD